MSLRSAVRGVLPAGVLDAIRTLRLRRARSRNARRSAEAVFTEIYDRNQWGGTAGEFCSGSGSVDSDVVTAYVTTLTALADREGFRGTRFVDLGCGDFRVGQRLTGLYSSYTGVDVVLSLVERNTRAYGSSRVRFLHGNICAMELPEGDVCLVRQVFQHLSNDEIASVIPRLARYRWVIVTEHYPAGPGVIPNRDKPHGPDIRLYDHSAVFLDHPPFSVPAAELSLELEVAGTGSAPDQDPGVIRTFLYKPPHSS